MVLKSWIIDRPKRHKINDEKTMKNRRKKFSKCENLKMNVKVRCPIRGLQI